MNFYIYDCNNELVGNPKGYRTIRGAQQQAYARNSKTAKLLHSRWWAKRDANPDHGFVTTFVRITQFKD